MAAGRTKRLREEVKRDIRAAINRLPQAVRVSCIIYDEADELLELIDRLMTDEVCKLLDQKKAILYRDDSIEEDPHD